MSDLVIQLHTAQPATRRERLLKQKVADLERRNTALEVQADALISAFVKEAMFVWVSSLEEPPTDAEVTARRNRLFRHYTGIALDATARKGLS